MHFEEVDAGDFRIYAGAIERPRSYGYVAAVVVMQVRGKASRREAFRDENLAGGYGWSSPADALRFAVNAGRDVVMCGMGALSQRDMG
ncbi:MAG TPA: hypothetical protein VJN44_14770 [Roseateles sp.]|nr:hypothetical protein [Roseateles sp.]